MPCMTHPGRTTVVSWTDTRHPHWTCRVVLRHDGTVCMFSQKTSGSSTIHSSGWHQGWKVCNRTGELVITIHCRKDVNLKMVRFASNSIVYYGIHLFGIILQLPGGDRADFLYFCRRPFRRVAHVGGHGKRVQ